MTKPAEILPANPSSTAIVLSDDGIVTRLMISVAIGIGLAIVHYLTLGRGKAKSETAAAMPLTLIALSLLVCMVMLIVGDDIARAFTLGGTLAIIRYRTSVEDTRDTAFVIAAVVAGMGIGTEHRMVVFAGIPIFAMVLIVSYLLGIGRTGSIAGHRVIVRVASDQDVARIAQSVAAIAKSSMKSIEMAKQGTAIDATFIVTGLDESGIVAMLTKLRLIEGVLGVDVKPD
jgi:hypothetical protein